MKLLKQYPGLPPVFPMELFNEEHVRKIHSQSLARLNERGGLSAKEMLCNILKCRWNEVWSMSDDEVVKKLQYYLENNGR